MRHPDLVVGVDTGDDAGVFRLDSTRALVQTVDFFTPIVDEPDDWGRIAAANALSDVYAMGATPLTALQLLGWPRGVLPFSLTEGVLRGGAEIMAEAGCTIVGGHSIDDQEPKYGFAVTGLVDPAQVITNAGARPGERLILTKPLGLGVATTAIKAGAAPPGLRDRAVAVMTELNAVAADAMREAGVLAATDVTGYGLLGHLREMMDASDTSALIEAGAVPVLDGVPDLVERGMFPGGSVRNLESVLPVLDAGDVDETVVRILADAQTSGGLVMSVAEGRVESVLSAVPGAVVIGAVTDRQAHTMALR